MGHPTDIFLEPLSKSCVCAICHDVLKDASSFKCGHTYCKECIDDLLKKRESSDSDDSDTNDEVVCPNCRQPVCSSSPNYTLRDVLDSMQVRCPSSEDINKRKRDEEDTEITGCCWRGMLKDLPEHESICKHKVIECPLDECNFKCQRKDMDMHMLCHDMIKTTLESQYNKKMKEIEFDYKIETNHRRYVMDCKSWVEFKQRGGDRYSNIAVYTIRSDGVWKRKQNYADIMPITGLLCLISCGGSSYPITVRYETALSLPRCRFPSNFFHLNVPPGGLVREEDFGWTPYTSLPQMLVDIHMMLHFPNDRFPRNARATILLLDSHVKYQERAMEEAARYRGHWINKRACDMLQNGESIDNTGMDAFISNCYHLNRNAQLQMLGHVFPTGYEQSINTPRAWYWDWNYPTWEYWNRYLLNNSR